MADGKVSCVCGKQYTWKPELAGKRAKCKCGSVVSFPAQRPGSEDEAGFEDDMGEIPMAPPPPPPPMPGAPSGAPAYAPPPPPPGRGTMPRGTMPKSGGRAAQTSEGGGGLNFSGKAIWNIIWGVGLVAFGIFLFVDISNREATGEPVRYRGRKMGWLNLMYSIGGKWGVVGAFGLIGLALIGFAVMVIIGKKTYDESE